MFIWKWASLHMLFVRIMHTHTFGRSGWNIAEIDEDDVGSLMSAPTCWYEPHGLRSRPRQSHALASGNQPSESRYTGSLVAFIMPHYYVHSPLIIHTAMICSRTVGECQYAQDICFGIVMVCRSVCWTKRMLVRVKCLVVRSVGSLDGRNRWITVKSVVFQHQLWNETKSTSYFSALIPQIPEAQQNQDLFKTSINLSCALCFKFLWELGSWCCINLL